MTQLLPFIVALAVFLGLIGIFALIVGFAIGRRRQRLRERLRGSAPGEHKRRGEHAWVMEMAERGQRLDQLLQDPEETSILLAQAGWRGARARAGFYAFQVLLPLLIVIGAVPLWLLLRGALEGWLAGLAVIAVLIVSILTPRMLLRAVAKRRLQRLRSEVPLFINLLILLFEAGLSTRQALASLVQDGAGTLPEISAELRPVLRQIEAGGETSTLLFEMGRLLDIQELESVLGILRQVEKYGGEVREPLTEALTTIEERRTMEIRERVNVMSGQMTVVLVLCFFPALLVLILGPAFVSIAGGLSGMAGR